MTTATVLAFEILRMMNAPETPALRERAAVAAVAIIQAARVEDVRPRRLAAIAMKESSFRPWIVGAGGELGLMQIKPGRMARALCGDLNLRDVGDNARCGARYLRRAEAICGDGPSALTLYNSSGDRPDQCRRSTYADRVMRIEARATGRRRPAPLRAGAKLLADAVSPPFSSRVGEP